MALYDFLCDTCKEKFEVIKSMTDDAPVIHQKCGNQARKAFNRSFFFRNSTTSGTDRTLLSMDPNDQSDWVDS